MVWYLKLFGNYFSLLFNRNLVEKTSDLHELEN